MNSRERMMIALDNGRPDRLPCQVHGWTDYYLNHYLDGMDWFEAYAKFDMDYAIYVNPEYIYDDSDLAKWQRDQVDLGKDKDGNHRWKGTITTPKGTLHHAGAYSEITGWETEVLIKNEQDFAIWNQFYPVPVAVDFSKLEDTKEKLGDNGIIRSHPFSPGQGSPWQSFCTMIGTESAIFMAMDKPDFLHNALEDILSKTLHVTELWAGTPADMVETNGGAGSSSVISPKMFEEFCVPYNQRQNELFHEIGIKVVCHLCGGLMPLLDLVAQAGADGLETMTPPAMGGDCDLAAASEKVGDKLFFIGGFDQNAGFENGTPERAKELVFECFEATKDHAGYIIAPSDNFFHGNVENLQAFADAVKQCVY
jgi:uroporphyrinogen decarboxylase